MLNFKGMRFPIDVIFVCIRWYLAYPLSYRHLEEMMEERGVSVDHFSITRWAIRFLPLIEKMARKHELLVGGSWRMDETYIKVKGVWKYLYRAVDKQGKTVDFLLTAKRDMVAAKRFFDKAMGANGDPDKFAMDKSGANKAAIDAINVGREGFCRIVDETAEFFCHGTSPLKQKGPCPPGHKIGRRTTSHRLR